MKLRAKQQRFCEEYLVDLNATQAAIRAGYSVKSANRIASKNLSKLVIKKKIQELQAKARELTDITKEEILSELAAILRAKITDYLQFNGKQIVFKSFDELTETQIKAIESIKENRHGEIEFRLYGKMFSIDRVCKILGLDATQDFNINLEKMDESAIDLIINRLTQKK